MSVPKLLLDSDILSELFKEIDVNVRANASRYLSVHPQLTFTSLSSLEILSGLERKQASVKLRRAAALAQLPQFESVVGRV